MREHRLAASDGLAPQGLSWVSTSQLALISTSLGGLVVALIFEHASAQRIFILVNDAIAVDKGKAGDDGCSPLPASVAPRPLLASHYTLTY